MFFFLSVLFKLFSLKCNSSTGVEEEHEEENVNLSSAFIHVVGDCVQSVGVMIAAALIWWKPNWKIAGTVFCLLWCQDYVQ